MIHVTEGLSGNPRKPLFLSDANEIWTDLSDNTVVAISGTTYAVTKTVALTGGRGAAGREPDNGAFDPIKHLYYVATVTRPGTTDGSIEIVDTKTAKLVGSNLALDEPYVTKDFRELLDNIPAYTAIAAHVPIGLPARATRGGRKCDREARKLLGWPRQAAIMSAPARRTLTAMKDYERAASLNGGHLDIITFRLLPKMAEVANVVEHNGILGRNNSVEFVRDDSGIANDAFQRYSDRTFSLAGWSCRKGDWWPSIHIEVTRR